MTARIGLFTVQIQPAEKFLPDGRNAHQIQKPAAWWLPRSLDGFELGTFNRMPMGFRAFVERKYA